MSQARQVGPHDDTSATHTRGRRIVEDCYRTAAGLLRDNRDMLDRLAHALLENETLGEEEAYAAAGVASPSAATGSLAAAS